MFSRKNDLERPATCGRLLQNGYKCRVCPKVLHNGMNRIRHERKHKLAYSIVCSCEKSFLELDAVKRHQQKVHKENKPFPCNYCANRFEVFKDFIDHMMINHNKEFWEISDSNFVILDSSAQSSSTQKRSETSTDDYCQSPITSSKTGSSRNPDVTGGKNYEVIRVMIPIQLRKMRSQICRCGAKDCQKFYGTAAELYHHCSERHNQLFMCRYCELFPHQTDENRKEHEVEHVLRVILINDWVTKHDDIAERSYIARYRKSNFECNFCRNGKVFPSFGFLHNHMMKHHKLDIPSFCPCCDVWFENKRRMYMHFGDFI